MTTKEVQEFIKHYGVQGMKWGVRTKGRSHQSSSATERVVKSKAKTLSNEDLKKHIERMRLEQQYSELATPGKRAGKKYAVELLKQSGSKLVGAAATAVATVAVASAFGKYTAQSAGRQEALKKKSEADETARLRSMP